MRELACDGAMLAGMLCVLVGLWWIYPPACMLALGATLIVGGMFGDKAWGL